MNRNKNIIYFLIFLLPALFIILFVHEMGHAVTAFILGATNISVKFFSSVDFGQVDFENLNGVNEGIALLMGPFATFLLSIILVFLVMKIKNQYARYFIFIIGMLSALDFISYALTGYFGLRHFIFIGSDFSIGEPEKALQFMNLPEIIAPILAVIMTLIYYPYFKIFQKIKWK